MDAVIKHQLQSGINFFYAHKRVSPEKIKPFSKAAARKNRKKCWFKGKRKILTDNQQQIKIDKTKKVKYQNYLTEPKKSKATANFNKLKSLK